MSYLSKARRALPVVLPTDIWTPGNEIELNALIGACALVAQADGWVTPDERKSMIDRLRLSPAIAAFGLEEVLQGFATLNERFDRDLDDGVHEAEEAVSRLAGRLGPSRLLVETACVIAAADGGFDAEERNVVLRLCDLLDLEPEGFDIVAR